MKLGIKAFSFYPAGKWRVHPSQKSDSLLLKLSLFRKSFFSQLISFQSDCSPEYHQKTFLQQFSLYEEYSLDCVMGTCSDGNDDCPCRRKWVEFNFKHYPFFFFLKKEK